MRRNLSRASYLFLGLVAACTARSDYVEPTDAPPIEGSASGGPSSSPAGSVFPNTDDGLPIMQLGLLWIDYANLEDKFLNILQSNGYSWHAEAPGTGRPNESFEDLYKSGFINKTTMLPTGIPSGYAYISSGLFRWGARYYPDYYAGTYVFDWEGDADARCGFGRPTTRINAHRIECVYPAGNGDWGRIELTRVTSSFANPRLYQKEDAAAIDSGGIFTAKFLGLLSGYKVIRMMDVQSTNTSWLRKASELTSKTQFGWGSSAERNPDIPELKRGAPLAVMVDMAVQSDTALWLNVPPVMGAPDGIEDAKYQDGTYKDDLKAFTKTNFDAIESSPEWRNYADRVVVALQSENYPKTHVLYQEVGNEIWNFGNPFWRMTYYYWGLGDALKEKTGASGESFRYALGWMTANYAVQFDAALKAAGRDDQQWSMVLAGQMVYLGRTTTALQGARDYFTARGLNADKWMKKIGVSTASYYNGIYDLQTGLFPAPDEASRDAQWMAAIAADPQGLMTKFADWVISSRDNSQTIPSTADFRTQQKAEAEKFGAYFLGDYEGNSHLQVPASLKANPAFLTWLRNYLMSDEAERVDTAWVEAMRNAAPNAIIANFDSIGPFVIDDKGKFSPADSPWIDGFWTDETGRDKALRQYLRKSN